MSWSSRSVSTSRYFSGSRWATCQTWRRVSFDSCCSTGSKARAVAQLVVAEVSRHRVNPAPEVERLVDPVHHPQGFHEGLLGDVFGEEGVTQLPADEPVNRRHVAAVELLEGAYIAGP